jgi:hypothetical protein
MTFKLRLLVLLALAVLADGLYAQTLETLEWVEGSSPLVARLTFSANVRFLRQAPAAGNATDLSQLGIQLIGANPAVRDQVVEEGRVLRPGAGRPGLELSYIPLTQVPTKLLTLRLTEKMLLQVRQGPNARTLDFELQRTAGTLARESTLPPMAQSPEDRHFAVLLQNLAGGGKSPSVRIPSEFQDYEVSTQPHPAPGASGSQLVLGYFANAADAERVRQRALKNFPEAEVLSMDQPVAPAPAPLPVPVPAPEPAPVVVAVAAPEPAPETATAPVLAVQEPEPRPQAPEIAARAKSLLEQARESVVQGRLQEATTLLNQGLLLPPNPSSETSQALIGEVWEQLRVPDKARLEYQLYLRLYPRGEAAERVAQRLASLGKAVPAAPALSAEPPSKYSVTGSVSQYYYGGNTKTDSLVNIASGIDQNTLTRTSQSVLVSSWDATARYQGEDSETKLVMRGAHSDNLASNSALTSSTQGLISAAYVDYRDLSRRLDLRAGRQSAIGGSMFGLFDGLSMAVPVGPGYKFDAMLGVPANQLVTAPQQTMSGVMLEADNLFDHWGGNVSLMEQTTESISDRRAVGMDVRYFGESVSLFSQIDYELNLQTLNAFTLQSSFQGPAETTVTVLLDDRKAPSLQLSDALISSGTTSLTTLLQLKSLNEVQRMALDTAAQARQAMISLSRPLSPKWQGSVDLRYSEIGALPAVGNFQAQPATGAQYNISLQVTGSNLYSSRDINGFNISYLTSDTLSGTQIAYNNLTGIWDSAASLEPSIRFYTQTDNTGTVVQRISPGLRISYKLSNRANFMGEAIYEQSQTDGPSNHETSASLYFYVGYRYDFH